MRAAERSAKLPSLRLLFVPLVAGASSVVLAGTGSVAVSDEGCLECHAHSSQSMSFKDGSRHTLRIDPVAWNASSHGKRLRCIECHNELDTDHATAAHPRKRKSRNTQSRRAYLAEGSDSCKRCHSAYDTKAREGIHYRLRSRGNLATPTCRDCHSVHKAMDPRSHVELSARCGTCHPAVYAAYRESAHGRALDSRASDDVPVCTSCHTAHSFDDPRTAEFHTRIPGLCANCHSDEEIMRRNGLTTAAYTTYLDDFHGKSNLVYSREEKAPTKSLASCTDCHGVHNIQSLRGPSAAGGSNEMKTRLLNSCRKCHKDVPATFADAWLSHYPATLATAPLLLILKKAYGLFNPVMTVVFVFNLLLDLWRVSARGIAGRWI